MIKERKFKIFCLLFLSYILINLFAGVFKKGNQEPDFLKQIRSENKLSNPDCAGNNYQVDQCIRNGNIPVKNWIFGYQMNLFSEEYIYFADPEIIKSKYRTPFLYADQLIIEIYEKKSDDYVYDIHYYPKDSQIRLRCVEKSTWGNLYPELSKEELPVLFNTDKRTIDEDWSDYEYLESEKNIFHKNICSGISFNGYFFDIKRLTFNFINKFNIFNQLGI